MKQKQHEGDPDNGPAKQDTLQDNAAAKAAAQKGKDLLNRLAQAQKVERKRGRYVTCCGVKVWVED